MPPKPLPSPPARGSPNGYEGVQELVDISFLDTQYPRAEGEEWDIPRGSSGGPSLAYGDSPCEYIPIRSTAASMRPTVPQAYVDQLLYSFLSLITQRTPQTIGLCVLYKRLRRSGEPKPLTPCSSLREKQITLNRSPISLGSIRRLASLPSCRNCRVLLVSISAIS